MRTIRYSNIAPDPTSKSCKLLETATVTMPAGISGVVHLISRDEIKIAGTAVMLKRHVR